MVVAVPSGAVARRLMPAAPRVAGSSRSSSRGGLLGRCDRRGVDGCGGRVGRPDVEQSQGEDQQPDRHDHDHEEQQAASQGRPASLPAPRASLPCDLGAAAPHRAALAVPAGRWCGVVDGCVEQVHGQPRPFTSAAARPRPPVPYSPCLRANSSTSRGIR